MKFSKKVAHFFIYLTLIFFSFICFFPFLWMLSSSFKTEAQIFAFPPQMIPDSFEWSNYANVFRDMPMTQYILNSIKITVIVLFFGCLVASMSGYAFTKIDFPFRNFMFFLPLCSMMIPNEVIIIPLFKIWTALGAVNTHIPLIVTKIVGAGGMYGVFLMRQYYLSVPTELCEAAEIDGCNPLTTYIHIFLPISGAAFATLGIHTFVVTWNDFFNPLIYLNDMKKYTIPLGLALYADEQFMSWAELMAASVIATLPLMIGFFCAQKKFVASMATSGLKS